MATRNGGPINIAAITAYLAFTQVFLTYHQKQTIPCNGSVLFYLRVSCFFRSSFCNCICWYFLAFTSVFFCKPAIILTAVHDVIDIHRRAGCRLLSGFRLDSPRLRQP